MELPIKSNWVVVARIAMTASAMLGLMSVSVANAQEDQLLYDSVGDSFIAGTGPANKSLYDPASGECWRLNRSWPVIIADQDGADLNRTECAGSQIDDILTRSRLGNRPQIENIRPNADVVFVSIGGNDLGAQGFGSVIPCPLLTIQGVTPEPECTRQSPAIVNAYDAINGRNEEVVNGVVVKERITPLKDRIVGVLQAIRAKAKTALIVLVGYPPIIPAGNEPAPGCQPWLSDGERPVVNDMESALNSSLDAAASLIGGTVFVNPMQPGSPFYGENGEYLGSCSWSPQRNMNNFEPGFDPGHLHPNLLGIDAYALAVRPVVPRP